MSEIVNGMTAEYERAFLSEKGEAHTRADAMRAALLWLAADGSEEIARRLCRAVYGIPASDPIPAPLLETMTYRVASAIGAAARGEG